MNTNMGMNALIAIAVSAMAGRSGNKAARDEIGAQDGPGAQQDREEADQVHGQGCAAPGEGLPVRVDVHVDVLGGARHAAPIVGIAIEQIAHVGRRDPGRQQGAHGVIQRRLAAFLAPQGLLARALHRQAAARRQVLDEGVVVVLVAGLEKRARDAVQRAQHDVDEQDRCGDAIAGGVEIRGLLLDALRVVALFGRLRQA